MCQTEPGLLLQHRQSFIHLSAAWQPKGCPTTLHPCEKDPQKLPPLDLRIAATFTLRKDTLTLREILNLCTHSWLFHRSCSLPVVGQDCGNYTARSYETVLKGGGGFFRVIIKGFAHKKKNWSFVQSNLKAFKLRREREMLRLTAVFAQTMLLCVFFFYFLLLCMCVCVYGRIFFYLHACIYHVKLLGDSSFA